MALKTRITEMLEIEKPIIQAAMGWIARSQLSSAFSNAGGMGIIETSSGELDAVRAEILKMRDLTDKPFGVNVAQAFVRDPDIVQFVIVFFCGEPEEIYEPVERSRADRVPRCAELESRSRRD